MSNYMKNNCTTSITIKTIVIIGGIDLGLIGLGMILGSMGNWNVLNILLGSAPVLEAVVYVAIGVAAVMMIFDCQCKKCKGSTSSTVSSTNVDEKKMEESV